MSPIVAICDAGTTREGAEALDFIFREGAFQGRARVGGMDVLQTLKLDELTRDIPVVILTGSTDERFRLVSEQLGAAGYHNEPVDLKGLKRVPTQNAPVEAH